MNRTAFSLGYFTTILMSLCMILVALVGAIPIVVSEANELSGSCIMDYITWLY